MKIEIRFELDSEEFHLDALKAHLQDERLLSALAQMADGIQQRLHNVTCPIHHHPPQIALVVSASGEIEPNISGCCSTLINIANGRFKKSLVQTAYFSPHMRLIVCVDDAQEPTACFEVEEIDRLVIGRSDPSGTEPPDIDLLPYEAVEKGVSRHHACIVWQNGALHLVDEDSANGTFVNGEQLVPRQPRILHNGDLLVLGTLMLRVRFEFE